MRVQSVLRVLVEVGPSGQPFYEQVLVEQEAAHYRLVKSPGLLFGVAAGDLIELNPDNSPRVIERGGNVCVQVYCRPSGPLEKILTPRFAALGGRLDGSTPKNLVYTVPVTVGFPAIEAVLKDLESPVDWLYGNVFDPADGITPLNWWKK
jgi:hypothetical protein